MKYGNPSIPQLVPSFHGRREWTTETGSERSSERPAKKAPKIFLSGGVYTKPKPKTNLTLTLSLAFLRVRVSFMVSFKFCLSGVLRWAKISLAHFSGTRTLALTQPSPKTNHSVPVLSR